MKVKMLCNVGTQDAARLGLDGNNLPKEGEEKTVSAGVGEKLVLFGVAEAVEEPKSDLKGVRKPSNVKSEDKPKDTPTSSKKDSKKDADD